MKSFLLLMHDWNRRLFRIDAIFNTDTKLCGHRGHTQTLKLRCVGKTGGYEKRQNVNGKEWCIVTAMDLSSQFILTWDVSSTRANCNAYYTAMTSNIFLESAQHRTAPEILVPSTHHYAASLLQTAKRMSGRIPPNIHHLQSIPV